MKLMIGVVSILRGRGKGVLRVLGELRERQGPKANEGRKV